MEGTPLVDACPTLALRFMEESEAKALVGKAEVIHPEYETRPRVYYLNVPRRFIAGTVYDPKRKEITKDAPCTLIASDSNKARTTKTDGFGDFWFEGLGVGNHELRIEAEGSPRKAISNISTEKDVNLGDLPL